jgi:hypothetical protein
VPLRCKQYIPPKCPENGGSVFLRNTLEMNAVCYSEMSLRCRQYIPPKYPEDGGSFFLLNILEMKAICYSEISLRSRQYIPPKYLEDGGSLFLRNNFEMKAVCYSEKLLRNTLKVRAVCSSETLEPILQATTQRHNPEDHNAKCSKLVFFFCLIAEIPSSRSESRGNQLDAPDDEHIKNSLA